MDKVNVTDYIGESIHNSWDGWEPDQIVVLELLIIDMKRAYKGGII